MQNLFQGLEEIGRKRKAILRGICLATTDDGYSDSEKSRYLESHGDIGEMEYHNLTIRQTPGAKTWYTRIRLGGNQIYISGKTQKQVVAKIQELLKQTESKTKRKKIESKTTKNITFGDFYKQWLDIYKRNLKESTKNTYKTTYNNVSTKFRKLKLCEIDTFVAVRELDKVPASRMKQRVYVLMKDVFSKAVKRRLMDFNPLEDVPTPKYDKKEKHIMTVSQQKVFEQACYTFKHGDAYLVALWQGLRRGELLMLKRNDIDFDNHTLTIDESITDKSSDTTTKNKYSNRTMPLFKHTEELLQKYKDYPENERIFKIDTKTLKLELDSIFESAKLNRLTLHELRHTFVTRCKEQNVPEHIIQSWVGHQIGSKVTSAVYTHVTEESSKKFADLLNNI